MEIRERASQIANRVRQTVRELQDTFAPHLPPQEIVLPANLEAAVALREAALRRRFTAGQGACVVGILATEFQAFNGLWGHANAVTGAGGEPRFLFPSRGTPDALMQTVDAVLVPGGPDVDPFFYGQEFNGAKAGMGREFDRFELDCIQDAYRSQKPMLGICRGLQLMNVAGQGTLTQDLYTQHPVPAGAEVDHGSTHPIFLAPGSKLHELLQTTEMTVNSMHHQCVGHLSPLLYLTAAAADGVVEGVQSKTCATQLGVQFHPEMMIYTDPRTRQLFDYLVDSGQQYRSQRHTELRTA